MTDLMLPPVEEIARLKEEVRELHDHVANLYSIVERVSLIIAGHHDKLKDIHDREPDSSAD